MASASLQYREKTAFSLGEHAPRLRAPFNIHFCTKRFQIRAHKLLQLDLQWTAIFSASPPTHSETESDLHLSIPSGILVSKKMKPCMHTSAHRTQFLNDSRSTIHYCNCSFNCFTALLAPSCYYFSIHKILHLYFVSKQPINTLTILGPYLTHFSIIIIVYLF